MAATAPPPSAKNIPPADIKIILLGDSAVGKSKLIERFLVNDFIPHQLSTYALTLYRHRAPHPTNPGEMLNIEFWDTAGQERFQSMHPSYYISAHCCILCFDMSRKITYKNLDTWYDELISHRGIGVPIIVVGNKVDMDPSRAKKALGFVERRRAERAQMREQQRKQKSTGSLNAAGGSNAEDAFAGEEDMPVFLCSASDGTNVVGAFKEAIKRAVKFKAAGQQGGTFVDEILKFIEEEESNPNGLFAPGRESTPPEADRDGSPLDSIDTLSNRRPASGQQTRTDSTVTASS
ncbi:Rab-like protein 2A [Chytridiales sp. JEL 0842]|nr:Rab-like protein 2A [Chytridiales sp. JEL 0842]